MQSFSIIIPTLNEEKQLPGLFKSIRKQTLQPIEIIVADCNSNDKTREVAIKYGCTVVKGGAASVGRNSGAKKAIGKILVFFDADIELNSQDYLSTGISAFVNQDIDLATCYYSYNKYNSLLGNLIIFGSNLRKKIDHQLISLFNIRLGGSGAVLFIKKSVFQKLSGYDENLEVYEDTDMLIRANKSGFKYAILPISVVLYSRKFNQIGLIQLLKLGYYLFMYKISKLFHFKSQKYYLKKYIASRSI